MPITFDTLEELKAFYRSFKIERTAGSARLRGKTPQTKARKQKAVPPKAGIRPKARKVKTSQKTQAKKEPLTAKIQSAAQAFIQAQRPFTNNDLYEAIARQNKGINKASAITAISKLMTTQFAQIPCTHQPGKGPRPVKVFNP